MIDGQINRGKDKDTGLGKVCMHDMRRGTLPFLGLGLGLELGLGLMCLLRFAFAFVVSCPVFPSFLFLLPLIFVFSLPSALCVVVS